MTDKDKKSFYLNLAKKAEKWMFIYIGLGCGFAASEYAFWVITKSLTPLSYAVIISFAASLANRHFRDWAMKKVECDTNEGQ